jgi:cell division protein FtsQ
MAAMSDTRSSPDSPNRDPEPDRAALDELRRAFGVEHEPAGLDDDGDSTAATDSEPVAIDTGDTEAAPFADPPSEADRPGEQPEEHAGEEPQLEAAHEPAPGEALDEAAEPAPTIVRIDDYRGPVPAPPPDLDAEQAIDVPDPAGDRQLISIDADDIPDAVYVEGSLDGGGSGSIVFIEDAPDSELLTPESDRDLRRGIEPRMRERRLAVKRAQGRKRLRWVVAGVVVVLIGVGALATLGSSLFAVRADQVELTGNVYTDRTQLEAVIDDLVGTPVLRVDTQEAERRLEAIPWVERAKVVTDFPHGVSIDISERRAVATYQGPDGRFRVLDTDARVLDVLDMWPFAYVLVSGPDAVDLEPGAFAPQGYVAAAELADNLTGSVRGQVERIEVTPNGSRLSMWLDDGSEIRFGEARDLLIKLIRLETVLTANPGRAPGPIDVSTAETTSPTPTVAPAG